MIHLILLASKKDSAPVLLDCKHILTCKGYKLINVDNALDFISSKGYYILAKTLGIRN